MESSEERKTHQVSQQKMASQLPRGTRIDVTGTQVEIKGSRNYTAHPLYVGPNEMYEDIVMRGLRADGLSSKLGVKNHKEGIARFISSLFKNDHRHKEIMMHFDTKRQRSNSAKSVFATMTRDELNLIKNEMFPTKIDEDMRNSLGDTFAMQTHKLQHCIEVLRNFQHTFKQLEPHTDLLSLHNFQTRGFFGELLTMMTDFIIQVVEDVPVFASNDVYQPVKGIQDQFEKEDTTAAKILLSVGSDVQRTTTALLSVGSDQRISGGNQTNQLHPSTTQVVGVPDNHSGMQNLKQNSEIVLDGIKPTDPANESKDWVTVMLDSSGEAKYLLVKTPKSMSCDSTDTEKFLQILSEQSSEFVVSQPEGGKLSGDVSRLPEQTTENVLELADFSGEAIVTSQPYLLTPSNHPQALTTLEISVGDSQPGISDSGDERKRHNEEYEMIDESKKRKR